MKDYFFCLFFLLPLLAHSQESREEEFISWIKTQSPEYLAKHSAEQLAPTIPKRMDSLTQLSGIFANGNVITMRVTVLATRVEFISMLKNSGMTLLEYEKEFTKMVRNMGCTQPANTALIGRGVDYKYVVSDKDFVLLFETVVSECK